MVAVAFLENAMPTQSVSLLGKNAMASCECAMPASETTCLRDMGNCSMRRRQAFGAVGIRMPEFSAWPSATWKFS